MEYFEDATKGEPLFYNISALSNFIAKAELIMRFNPTARFVDYLERELDALRWARR